MQNNSGLSDEVSSNSAVDWPALGSRIRLLDLVSDRVFAFDDGMRVVRTNAPFDSAFGGGNPTLVVGRSFGDVVACRSVTAGACGRTEACRLCGWFAAADSVRIGDASVQECRILTGSGDAFDFDLHAVPSGVQGFGVCVLKDLHTSKRLRVLERTFFHDVINLAIGVKGLTEMFDLNDPAQTEEYVKMIHDSSEKMVDEILRLRTLRSAESGDLTTCYGSVSANELLHVIVSYYAEAASARRLNVVIESQDATVFETDRELVQMVLGSLVINAIEASARGNRVTVGYSSDEDAIVFYVRNEQILSDEVRLQMFERSFSTKGPGKGVGAYSAKLITERYLGGQVWFDSRAPDGTAFCVRLPIVARS